MSGDGMGDLSPEDQDFDLGGIIGIAQDGSSQSAVTREQPQEELIAELSKLLGSLHPREAGIIRARFGLGGSRQKTRDEISEEFGITVERIRQIESKSMSKLRFRLRSTGRLYLLDGR